MCKTVPLNKIKFLWVEFCGFIQISISLDLDFVVILSLVSWCHQGGTKMLNLNRFCGTKYFTNLERNYLGHFVESLMEQKTSIS